MSAYNDLSTTGPLFEMQAAIEARLQLAFPLNRFQHEILPAAVTPAMWSELARRTPMITLGFLGMKADAASGRQFKARAEWRVVPVIRNPAGARARLLGDRNGPGQLGISQVAVAALHGMTIPNVGIVEVTDVANLWAEGYADEHAALSGITLSVLCGVAPALATTDPDFLRLGVTWAFDPGTADAASSSIKTREGT